MTVATNVSTGTSVPSGGGSSGSSGGGSGDGGRSVPPPFVPTSPTPLGLTLGLAKYAISTSIHSIRPSAHGTSYGSSSSASQVTQQTYAQRLASNLGISEAEAIQRLNTLGISTARATAVIPDSGGDIDLSPKSSLSVALKEINKAVMSGASEDEISALTNAYYHGEKVQYAPTVVQKYTQPDGTFNLVQAVKDNVSRDYLTDNVGLDAGVVDAVALMNSKGLIDAQGQYSPPQAIAAGVSYETLASLGLTKHEYNDWQQKITTGEYAGYGAGLEYAQRTLSKDYIPTVEEFKLAHPEIKTEGERIAAYKTQYGNFSYSSDLVKYPGGRSHWEYEKVPTQLSRSWTTEFTPPKELTAMPAQLTTAHSVTPILPTIPKTYHFAPVSSEGFTKQFIQAAKDKGLEPEGKKEKATWKELMTREANKEYAARYGEKAAALSVTTEAAGTVFPVVKGLYYPESEGITLGQMELTGVNLALLGGGTEALAGITKGLSAAGRSVTKLGGKLFGVKPVSVAREISLPEAIAGVEQGQAVLSGLKAGTPAYEAAKTQLETASAQLEQAVARARLTAPEGAQPIIEPITGKTLPYRAAPTLEELGGVRYHPVYKEVTIQKPWGQTGTAKLVRWEAPSRIGATYRASPESLRFMKSPEGKVTWHRIPSKITIQENVMPTTTRTLARLQGIGDTYGRIYAPEASPGNVQKFVTSRGSEYRIIGKGTQRTMTPEIQAEQGLSNPTCPTSSVTYYLTKKQAEQIGTMWMGKDWEFHISANNELVVAALTQKGNLGIYANLGKVATTPERGLSPLEIFGDETGSVGYHIGDVITKISRAGNQLARENLPALGKFGGIYGETQPYKAVSIEAPYYSEVWLYPRVAPSPLEGIKLPKAYPALERIPQATYGEFTPERFGAGKPVYTVAKPEELLSPPWIPKSRVIAPPLLGTSPVKVQTYTEPQLYYQWETLGGLTYLRPTYNPKAIIILAGTGGGVSQRRLVAPALAPLPIVIPKLSSAAATALATSTATSTEAATQTETEAQPAIKPATKTTTATTEIPTPIETTPIPPDLPGDEFIPIPIPFPKLGGAGGETGSRGYTKHGRRSAYIKMFGKIPELRVYLPAIFGEKRVPRISSSLWAKLQHHPEIETLEETGIESTPFGKKRVFTVAERIKVTTGAKRIKEISHIPTKGGFVNPAEVTIPDRYYLGHKLPEGSVSEVI